jgi:tyrosinase
MDEIAESAAVAGRALAFIEAEPPASTTSPQVRVFLNCDYLSAETPPVDPHYVGSFAFFPGGTDAHGGHSHLDTSGDAFRFAFDLTMPLIALRAAGRLPTDQLVLQVQPVANGTGEDLGPVKVRSVELAVTAEERDR